MRLCHPPLLSRLESYTGGGDLKGLFYLLRFAQRRCLCPEGRFGMPYFFWVRDFCWDSVCQSEFEDPALPRRFTQTLATLVGVRASPATRVGILERGRSSSLCKAVR